MKLTPSARASRAAGLCTVLCGLLIGTSAAQGISLVAIGNSITRHGPAPDIHWSGNWGMAASSAESDYVGQLTHLLANRLGEVPTTQRFTHVALERRPNEATASPELLSAARSSQLLVVELGDNVNPSDLSDFGRAYASLLAKAGPNTGVLVCLSTWWKSTPVDALMKPACEQAGGTFVDIGDIRIQIGTAGSAAPRRSDSTDPAVLSHPGDAGMTEMANRIFSAWLQHSSAAKQQTVGMKPS